MSEQEILGRAAQIITIAMGTRVMGRGRGTKYIRIADDDPLAYWLGVEAILKLVAEAGSALSKQEA